MTDVPLRQFQSRAQRILFAPLVAVAAALLLPGCGMDETNPREVYLELRSLYERENYEEMLELMHRSAREQLSRSDDDENAVNALRRRLPPRAQLEGLLEDVFSENPEALEALDSDQQRELFYRLQAAREVVRRKPGGELSAREQELRGMDLRYALAFSIPDGELGRRMDPQTDGVEFNLRPAGQFTLPFQRDSQNRVRFMWPRESR